MSVWTVIRSGEKRRRQEQQLSAKHLALCDSRYKLRLGLLLLYCPTPIHGPKVSNRHGNRPMSALSLYTSVIHFYIVALVQI